MNKKLFVDVIIKNQEQSVKEYIQDSSLFAEHLEILNTNLQIPDTFNHYHFGKNKQFINSDSGKDC